MRYRGTVESIDESMSSSRQQLERG